MAADTHIWIGGAPKLAQVDTVTPGGTIEADDLFIIQLEDRHGNIHTMSVAAGGTTPTLVVTALKAQATILHTAGTAPWNAVTCSGTATFVITADTAGEPFWATASTTEANGDAADAQTFAITSPQTTPSQSNLWDDDENYDTSIVPESGDTWLAGPMAGGSANDVYGSDQSAILLVAFTVQPGCNISIGDPGRYLQIDSDAVSIEAGGTSAGTICLDIDNCAAVNVKNCKSVSTVGDYGLYLVGTGNTILTIASTNTGKISVAALAGETAIFPTISCYAGTLVIGSGTTMATALNAVGGTIENNAATATITNEGATLTHATGAVTDMYLNGGVTYMNATGTIATIYVRDGATLDFSQDSRTKTVTTIKASKGAIIRDPNGVVASLVIQYINCRPEDVTLEGPANKKATWAAI